MQVFAQFNSISINNVHFIETWTKLLSNISFIQLELTPGRYMIQREYTIADIHTLQQLHMVRMWYTPSFYPKYLSGTH